MWSIAKSCNKEEQDVLLQEGYEPFAVVNDLTSDMVYFKKEVPIGTEVLKDPELKDPDEELREIIHEIRNEPADTGQRGSRKSSPRAKG